MKERVHQLKPIVNRFMAHTTTTLTEIMCIPMPQEAIERQVRELQSLDIPASISMHCDGGIPVSSQRLLVSDNCWTLHFDQPSPLRSAADILALQEDLPWSAVINSGKPDVVAKAK